MEWHLLTLRPDGPSTFNILKDAIGFKKGGGWEVPLHPYLAEELRKLRAYHSKCGFGSNFLFPSLSGRDQLPNAQNARKERGYVHHFNGSLERLRKLTSMPHLRANDFRDTVGSYATALYGKNFVTEKLLDHRVDGTNVGPDGVGLLYVSALPPSFEASAQVRKAYAAPGEAYRPFIEGFGDTLLMLAGRLREQDMTPYQKDFWHSKVKPIFRVDHQYELETGFTMVRWLEFVAQAPQMALNDASAHNVAVRLGSLSRGA